MIRTQALPNSWVQFFNVIFFPSEKLKNYQSFLPGRVLSLFRPGNWCVTERFLQGHCEWASCTISTWNSLPHGIIHATYLDNMNRVGLKKQKRVLKRM